MTRVDGKSNMSVAELENVTKAWPPISRAVRVPHTETDYQDLVELLDRVTDEVGEDENHPLASLMNVLGVLIEKYEDERVPELTELRRPLREIKIHPAALPSSEAFGLRDVQAATARLGRQENVR